MLFPTMIGLLKLGFVNTSDSMSVLRHPMWPGLLFRRVTSKEEALDVGGICLIDTVSKNWLIEVGRSLRQANACGYLGYIGMPGSAKALPSGKMYPGWVNTTKRQYDTLACATSVRRVKVVDPTSTDVACLAVLTRANEGTLAYCEAGPLEENAVDQTPHSANVSTVPSYGGEFRLSPTAGFTENGVWGYRWAGKFAGYLALTDYEPLGDYLNKRKTTVLESIDGKVRSHYADAHDQYVKSLGFGADELVPGWRFALNVHPAGGWVIGTTLKRWPKTNTGIGTLPRLEGFVETGSSPSGTTQVAYEMVPRNDFLYAVRNAEPAILEGYIKPQGSSVYAHAVTNSAYYNAGHPLAFDAMAVPYSKVTTPRGDSYASALIGGILLGSKPAATRDVIASIVEDEEFRVSGWGRVWSERDAFQDTGTDAQIVQNITAGFDSRVIRQSLMPVLIGACPEMGGHHAAYINGTDELVRSAVGA